MSIVSGTVTGVLAADAQGDANKVNRQNSRDTNLSNLLLQLMARGGTIDAATAKKLGLPPDVVGKASALLPYYMGDIEKNAGLAAGSMTSAIQQLQGTPQYQGAQYQQIFEQFRPAFEANAKTASDLATGATTQQMLTEAQPVFQARTDLATGRKNAALESLRVTLNNIDNIQARKGFSGDSSGNQMLKFNASRSIATGAADDVNQTRLQNAMEKAGLQEQGRVLQRGNINLPDTLAGAAVNRVGAPGRAMAENANTALLPLKFFNLGQHDFNPLSTPPSVNPVPSPFGVMAAGAADTGNNALNYYLKKLDAAPPPRTDGYGQSSGYGSYQDTSGTYNPGPAVTSVDVPV